MQQKFFFYPCIVFSFFFWSVGYGQTDSSALEARLKQDFKELLQKEPPKVKNALTEAEQTFELVFTQKLSWNDYTKATTLILKNRSKAAIPMIVLAVKSCYEKQRNIYHVFIEEVVFMLGLLAGKKVLVKESAL
ncbi:MAG: hypothetical protein AABZ60_09590 [Planctomycetota bacterium]